MKVPNKPRQNEIPRFDQWGRDDRKSSGGQPDEHETDSNATGASKCKCIICWIPWPPLLVVGGGDGGILTGRHGRRSRRLRLRWPADEAGEGKPGAEEIDGDEKIFGQGRMTEDDPAKDVKDIMAIIGEGKGMNDGVEMNDEEHDGDEDGRRL